MVERNKDKVREGDVGVESQKGIIVITLLGKYEGSQTTFLHLAVSPSDVTPTTLPSSLNFTWHLDQIKLSV
jgi:hypothetical protein